jgi:hypothetical protein
MEKYVSLYKTVKRKPAVGLGNRYVAKVGDEKEAHVWLSEEFTILICTEYGVPRSSISVSEELLEMGYINILKTKLNLKSHSENRINTTMNFWTSPGNYHIKLYPTSLPGGESLTNSWLFSPKRLRFNKKLERTVRGIKAIVEIGLGMKADLKVMGGYEHDA